VVQTALSRRLPTYRWLTWWLLPLDRAGPDGRHRLAARLRF